MSSITILAMKYDRRPHFEWTSQLVADSEDMVATLAPPGTICVHYGKDLQFELEHFALGIFLPRAWWNAILDFDPDGNPLIVYCNIAMPLKRRTAQLEWVDLDLDVVCTPGAAPELVDVDEFEANADLFAYPIQVTEKARRTAHELMDHAARHAFPFQFPNLHELLRDLSSDSRSMPFNRER